MALIVKVDERDFGFVGRLFFLLWRGDNDDVSSHVHGYPVHVAVHFVGPQLTTALYEGSPGDEFGFDNFEDPIRVDLPEHWLVWIPLEVGQSPRQMDGFVLVTVLVGSLLHARIVRGVDELFQFLPFATGIPGRVFTVVRQSHHFFARFVQLFVELTLNVDVAVSVLFDELRDDQWLEGRTVPRLVCVDRNLCAGPCSDGPAEVALFAQVRKLHDHRWQREL